MDTYIYMTVFPEALVGSMLPPQEFGPYAAVGSRKRCPGRAILFEIDRDRLAGHFDLSLLEHVKPHPDGLPKHSVTISIYRVLELIPMDAFGRLLLVTRDGKCLTIEPRPYTQRESKSFRLYQELCPIHPTVLSRLHPDAFCKYITDPSSSVRLPKLLFADLVLGQIADSASDIPTDTLPYAEIGLIRDAVEILNRSKRHTLVVDRPHSHDFFYRTVGEGFFIGDGAQLLYYPFPSLEEREGPKHDWWRSAELS